MIGKIVSKKNLSEKVLQIDLYAPRIARNRKAGHFVIIKLNKNGERIPLTISSANTENGTIQLIVQIVGVTSHKLSKMKIGDVVEDVVGPLGEATHIENYGTVLCAGGGVGIAPLLPIVQALKEAGNRVLTVLAARSEELIILEEQMKLHSDELIVMTDDGSYGNQGLVTHGMEEFINREQVDFSVVIGPAIMMKFSSQLTKKFNIPTIASLNTIMVDGTGMCGACRVSINGKTKFACVDGPEFDAHEIDFDEMLQRLGGYKEEERAAYESFIHTLNE